MKFFILFVIILELLSCNSSHNRMKQLVSQWQYKKIIFPEEIKQQILANDSTHLYQYKILNYIDTNGCTMCHLKLYEWRKLKDEADSLGLNLSFIFIAHLHDYYSLIKLQKLNKFPIPIIQDTTGIMNKQNKFPNDPLFQTFLLDCNNRILIIGNPINNQQLWSLYKKTIKENSNNKK